MRDTTIVELYTSDRAPMELLKVFHLPSQPLPDVIIWNSRSFIQTAAIILGQPSSYKEAGIWMIQDSVSKRPEMKDTVKFELYVKGEGLVEFKIHDIQEEVFPPVHIEVYIKNTELSEPVKAFDLHLTGTSGIIPDVIYWGTKTFVRASKLTTKRHRFVYREASTMVIQGDCNGNV
jgi:hypothetical protein